MNLHSFYAEFHDLSEKRQVDGLRKLFETALKNLDDYEDFVMDCLSTAVALEEDDYWGTEGLDV